MTDPEGGRTGSRFQSDRVLERLASARQARRERHEPPLQWPLMLVLGGLVLSLGIVSSDHFKRGSVLFAGFVLLAFVLRLVLRDRTVGWLAVRSRRTDLICLGFLAISVTVFALIVPPPS